MLWPFGSTWRPVRQKRRDTVDLRWLSARTWTRRWYPQGIDLGEWQGRRTLAVSWFRQDLAGTHLASRVTLVDLERSRHLDILLTVPGDGDGDGDGDELEPAPIHAGGLAWFEDRLFVAATRRGIWEFDLSDIRTVRGAVAQRLAGARPRGGRTTALVAVRTRVHAVPCAARTWGGCSTTQAPSAARPHRRVPPGRHREDRRVHDSRRRERGIRRRGCLHPGNRADAGRRPLGGPLLRVAVGSSAPRRPVERSTRRAAQGAHPLPVGCEDLALDLDAGLLWSLGEHPWRRVVRGIPLARLGVDGGHTESTERRT
ncbi:hypothetical protein [Microbacterium sp. Se63.02b]|uniref:hypothetical protein n=1 Tax=Microbacterium sp. Se63.02b TaxID=2709304 RepID=UPI00160531B6|nr:hypothetical protein [Microbacterium sp. Se63.02b]QNA93453.1 hypothetical protein G4G29_16120 [Microbacterium sp. Se63.02b]